MKRFLHIVLVLVAVAACQGPRVIPKDTLTDIYVEMFLADQLVRERNLPHNQMDTMLVYEAVFNKYGYDTDDYLNSVQHYLKDPERFAKVFEEVAKRLEGEVKALDRIIEHEKWVADRLAEKHPLADSILSPFSKDAVYVGLARVARDTSRYPAWFRLVAVQEDTLMVPVDSAEARKVRKERLDSLAAVKDSLAAVRDSLAAVKDTLPAGKETLKGQVRPPVETQQERPPRRLRPRSIEKESVEEVAEEAVEEEVAL